MSPVAAANPFRTASPSPLPSWMNSLMSLMNVSHFITGRDDDTDRVRLAGLQSAYPRDHILCQRKPVDAWKNDGKSVQYRGDERDLFRQQEPILDLHDFIIGETQEVPEYRPVKASYVVVAAS